MEGSPAASRPAGSGSPGIASAPPPSASASAASAPPTPTLAQAVRSLTEAGYPGLAAILTSRVHQDRPKMKMRPEEGILVASYLVESLPSMPHAQRLAAVMPKTSIELVRSVHERGVPAPEAEAMADYLVRLRDGLQMGNPTPFDENCSHVIGREWSEINYVGERVTWENQKRVYEPQGIPNFKTVASLERFFRVESKAAYFQKLYRPSGSVP